MGVCNKSNADLDYKYLQAQMLYQLVARERRESRTLTPYNIVFKNTPMSIGPKLRHVGISVNEARHE